MNLTFPAGRAPGFDPTHVALAGCQCRLSAVASGTGFFNVFNGNPATVVGGALTAGIDGIVGPGVSGYASTPIYADFPNAPTVVENRTFAAIVQVGSTGFMHCVSDDANGNGGNCLGYLGGNGIFIQRSGATDFMSSILLTLNHYYLIVASSDGVTTTNGMAIDLQTGQILTQTRAPGNVLQAGVSGLFGIGIATSALGGVWTGNIAAVAVFKGLMSIPQMLEWAQDPWSFWYPPRRTSRVGVAASNIIIAAGAGSFTITGEPATFLEKLLASPGSLTITGEPLTLAQVLAASPGSFTITGEPLTLAQLIAASPGSFTISGQPAAFTQVLVIAASPGSFNITGEPLVFNEVLTLAPGSYTIGGASGLTFSFTNGGVTIAAGAGNFVIIVGPDADFTFTNLDTNQAPSSFYHFNSITVLKNAKGPSTITSF